MVNTGVEVTKQILIFSGVDLHVVCLLIPKNNVVFEIKSDSNH